MNRPKPDTLSKILRLTLAFSFVTTNAAAATIDFTEAIFHPAGASAITRTVGGITVTVEATAPAGARLFWNGVGFPDAHGFSDGFGVQSSSYEADEVEGPDRLKISFSPKIILSEIGITDLFYEGRPRYRERGFYSLDGGLPVSFLADVSQRPSPASNGLLTLTGFPSTPVSDITFSAPGIQYWQDHEFAVRNVDVVPAPVPEPSSLLLMGSGVVALGLWGRKRRSAKTEKAQ